MRLAGQDVPDAGGVFLPVEPGTLRLTGQDLPSIEAGGTILAVEPGTLRLVGQDIGFTPGSFMDVQPGTLRLVGQDVTDLESGTVLLVEPGTLRLVGQNVVDDDDRTPAPYDLGSFTGLPLNALDVESNIITVSGLGVPVDCVFEEVGHVTGEYRLNGGPWTDLATFQIDNGDTLQVRCDAASTFLTEHAIIVRIGLGEDRFSVFTLADPAAPSGGLQSMTVTMGITL